MHIIEVRNVCEALPRAMELLTTKGHKQPSRGGDVYTVSTPVLTVYTHPNEMVLFNNLRDANPFFHIMEGCWMLAGRRDAKFLNHYVKDFGERYAENDGFIHGAYGSRWFGTFGINQIGEIIGKLKRDKLDRQTVVAMWDPTSTDVSGMDDLTGDWKDRCCNTHIYFRVVDNKLDMTTMARSHDALWGATGANAVHFPILQQYIAGMVGIETGRFYQFSNNYHLYVDAYDKLINRAGKLYPDVKNFVTCTHLLYDNRYIYHDICPTNLVTNSESFDSEFVTMMEIVERIHNTVPRGDESVWEDIVELEFKNKFLLNTVLPMVETHWIYSHIGKNEALEHINFVESSDWQVGGREWLERRRK